MTQVTTFFEAEFFEFTRPLPPAERAKQFEHTNLIIELGQHGFSQAFVDNFVDERLKLMQETQHSALLNYAQTYQHRPLAQRIIASFINTKPEAVAASLRENMTIRATDVQPGKAKPFGFSNLNKKSTSTKQYVEYSLPITPILMSP